MSHRKGGSGVPVAPPPPALSKHSSSRSSKSTENSQSTNRVSERGKRRSRSRSADERRNRYSRTDSSRRQPKSRSRSKSPRAKASSSSVATKSSSRNAEPSSRSRNVPTSSSSFSTSASTAGTAKRSSAATVPAPIPSRSAIIAPAVNLITAHEFAPINRSITAPEEVKIPRRIGEGVRPIFDRPELRDAIQRRMESGDNEINPSYPQEPVSQRVVAIIREPVEVMSLPLKSSADAAAIVNETVKADLRPASRDRYASIINERERRSRSRSPRLSSRSHKLSPPPQDAGRERGRGERSERYASPVRLDRQYSRGRSSVRSRSRERTSRDGHPDRQMPPSATRSDRYREPERVRGTQSHENIREALFVEEHRRQAPPEPSSREREQIRRDMERERSRYVSPVPRSRSRSPLPVPRYVEEDRQRVVRDHHVRERDLRNTLSRPPGKVIQENRPFEERGGHSGRFRGRGRGFSRARGRRPPH